LIDELTLEDGLGDLAETVIELTKDVGLLLKRIEALEEAVGLQYGGAVLGLSGLPEEQP
jgi:hypothetical protein